MKPLLLLAMLAAPASLAAQVVPQPSLENPRIQIADWREGEEIRLTALPMTGMTILLEPGERVNRVSLDQQGVFDVRVSAELDGLLAIPSVEGAAATMLVETDRRVYRFALTTGTGLMAAYLVQLRFGEPPITVAREWDEPTGQIWRYRLRGDRSVRPAAISDDGLRTRILFGEDQPLPGIFAVGPTGDEQVVNGHMREGLFVIDRVWDELIFRIDKDKATARRNSGPEGGDG